MSSVSSTRSYQATVHTVCTNRRVAAPPRVTCTVRPGWGLGCGGDKGGHFGSQLRCVTTPPGGQSGYTARGDTGSSFSTTRRPPPKMRRRPWIGPGRHREGKSITSFNFNTSMLATFHIPDGRVGVPSPGQPGWGYAGSIPTTKNGLGLVRSKRVRVGYTEPHTIWASYKAVASVNNTMPLGDEPPAGYIKDTFRGATWYARAPLPYSFPEFNEVHPQAWVVRKRKQQSANKVSSADLRAELKVERGEGVAAS